MQPTTELTAAVAATGRAYHRVAANDELKWTQEKAHLLHLIENSTALQACTAESLGNAALQAGAMGLSLNPMQRHVYLIPRAARRKLADESWNDYNRKKANGEIPQLAYASPSYMGLLEVAVASGRVVTMVAEVVFEGDHFDYRGPLQPPTHSAVLDPARRQEKNAIGVYTIAILAHGGIAQSSFMDREQILRCRALSDNSNGLMWNPEKLWTEGWKKTAIRRAWKSLPRSDAMGQAEQIMDVNEGIVLDQEPEAEAPPATITTEQVQLLTDKLPDDVEKPKWLTRLAIRFGVNRVEDVPAAQFDAVSSLLDLSLRERSRAIEDQSDAGE